MPEFLQWNPYIKWIKMASQIYRVSIFSNIFSHILPFCGCGRTPKKWPWPPWPPWPLLTPRWLLWATSSLPWVKPCWRAWTCAPSQNGTCRAWRLRRFRCQAVFFVEELSPEKGWKRHFPLFEGLTFRCVFFCGAINPTIDYIVIDLCDVTNIPNNHWEFTTVRQRQSWHQTLSFQGSDL